MASCWCPKNGDGVCPSCREILYGSFKLIVEGSLFSAEKEIESHRTCLTCAKDLSDYALSRVSRELLGDSPSEVRRKMLMSIIRIFREKAGTKTPLLDHEMKKCGEMGPL